jgi:hypothetical protein
VHSSRARNCTADLEGGASAMQQEGGGTANATAIEICTSVDAARL